MSWSSKFNISLDNYIKMYLEKNQGVRLGETTVVSNKVHVSDPTNPGRVHVLTDLDAGVHYLKMDKEGQVLHVDVFHNPTKLDPVLMADRIWETLWDFLKKEFNYPEDLSITDEDLRNGMKALGKRMILSTGNGFGTVFDLASRRINKKKIKDQNHVHLLMEFPQEFSHFLPILVNSLESAILRQGAEIHRIDQVVNCESTDECAKGIRPLKKPQSKSGNEWQVYKQNRWQVVTQLVNALGSVEEVVRFLETLKGTRNIFLSAFSKKHDDIDKTLQRMVDRKLVKKGFFGYKLTEEGDTLVKYLRENKKELEAQIRKTILKVPQVSRRYQTFRYSYLKSAKKRSIEKKKVIPLSENNWLTNLAIPETVVRSITRNFLEGSRPLTKINRKDVQIYDQASFAPVDTCLLLDCSGSMVGQKIRAVSYLAEHLLLSTREKVGVVAFQEMNARVVSPFTKNYYELQKGLRSIIPEGLTPLAKGMVESLELIKKQKARNPLLVLITDGLPNFPLWTTNANKDALKAARMVADEKIRFVCIGIEAYKEFLTELTQEAKGNLYIVEEFEKNQLVGIIHNEWEHYKSL